MHHIARRITLETLSRQVSVQGTNYHSPADAWHDMLRIIRTSEGSQTILGVTGLKQFCINACCSPCFAVRTNVYFDRPSLYIEPESQPFPAPV